MWNESAERIFGWQKDEVLRASLCRSFPPEFEPGQVREHHRSPEADHEGVDAVRMQEGRDSRSGAHLGRTDASDGSRLPGCPGRSERR